MYNQIIYFLVVLFIFSFQDTEKPFLINARISALLFLLQFFIFYFLSRELFSRAFKKVIRHGVSPHVAGATTENILNVFAIVFLVFLVFGVQVGRFFKLLPFVSHSATLMALSGLGLYFIYLAIIWYHAFKFHSKLGGSISAPREYLKHQIVLYIGVLLPWIFLSVVSEILENFIPFSFLKTEEGEILAFLVGIVLFFVVGPGLVIKVWKCKPIPYEAKRRILEDFCRENNFKVRNLMFWPLLGGQTLTAAIVGFFPRWRYILITPSLYSMLDPEELKAVVAHEMGHIRRYHIPFYLAFFVAFSVLLYVFADIILVLLLSNPGVLHLAIYTGTFGQSLFALICTVPFLFILILYFRVVFGYFMRNCERQADLFALRLVGTPWPLISSFQKIALANGNIEDVPSWHHYSIRQRIDFLRRAYLNPKVGDLHENRLKKSIVLFFALVFAFSIFGRAAKNSDWYMQRNIDITLNIIAQEMKLSGISPEIYASYGGYLTQNKRYDYARLILEKGAKAYPNNPEILNNLAWFYATSPPPFRSPKRAVALALKAVRLDPTKPYIWDTLAEAYYSAGEYHRALKAIERALRLETNKYYISQKEKILKAMKTGDREDTG